MHPYYEDDARRLAIWDMLVWQCIVGFVTLLLVAAVCLVVIRKSLNPDEQKIVHYEMCAPPKTTMNCPPCATPQPVSIASCGRDEVLHTDVNTDGKSSNPRCVPIRPTPPSMARCLANEVQFGASCIPIQHTPPSMVVCTANEAKIGDIKNRVGKIVAEDCVPLPTLHK